MATWAQNIRHPWFDPPTMKRKLFSDDDPGDPCSDVSPATFSTSRRKRVRCDSLERTLAHMTLGSALATTTEDVGMWPKISLPCPGEPGTLDVILPSSVEEPGTHAPESVEMDVEPTLDTTETPSPYGVPDRARIASGEFEDVQVSRAVLDCIKRQSRDPPWAMPLSRETSQALVLYRAPGPPSRCEQARDEDDVMEVVES